MDNDNDIITVDKQSIVSIDIRKDHALDDKEKRADVILQISNGFSYDMTIEEYNKLIG